MVSANAADPTSTSGLLPTDSLPPSPSPVPLPSVTATAALAHRALATVSAHAAALTGAAPLPLDPTLVAAAFTSDRWFRLDGAKQTAFAELSGFFRTRDGWVRTHANYPHHGAALRRGLALGPNASAESAIAALAQGHTDELACAITAAGGLCVGVAAESPTEDARLLESPLLSISRSAVAPAAPWDVDAALPLSGIRVLDLTRVIAGPVATRTLALLGADVLRIDPPHIPEPEWQHLDTGHGKRSTLLDLSSAQGRARFDELLETTDVVVLGYRPVGLSKLGLDAEALHRSQPSLIVAQLSAWANDTGRGFDSLVQAASGIALIESVDGDTPGVLPAQALDHTAGYLLAAAIIAALRRRSDEGGGWTLRTSLRRVAAELLSMPRSATTRREALVYDGMMLDFDVDGRRVTTVPPALTYVGAPGTYAAPRRWGGDEAVWLPR